MIGFKNLPDQIFNDFKKYVQEVQKTAIKNCNLKDDELKLDVIKNGNEMNISFLNIDEKKLECLKKAILDTVPTHENLQKILLSECDKTKEKLKSKQD